MIIVKTKVKICNELYNKNLYF